MSNKAKELKYHRFVLNPRANGGESLTLHTTFIDNGDPGPGGIFTNQRLTLQSYNNAASLELYGAQITPDVLRKLANELERALAEAASAKCVDEAIAVKTAV